MPLTNTQVKSAKVSSGQKSMKLSDGGGLYIFITPSGKYWRMNYRFGGKQNTVAFGVYPTISLREARKKRDEAKQLLAKHVDPNIQKKKEKEVALLHFQADTFQGVAEELIVKNKTKWSAGYTKSTQSRLKRHVFPWLGHMIIKNIEAIDVLALLRRIEGRGTIEMAHRVKMLCGQVFRYAVATGRIKADPTRDLSGALSPLVTTHRATIIDPKKIGELLRAIDAFEGTLVVQCALKMTPYVFVRPGELRHAKWDEINFESAEWRLPAEKMKMRVAHIVPLSKQVQAILREVQALTGSGEYVFPSLRSPSTPMSENTINATLRRIGFSKEEICAHGFRAMASTLLHEQGWDTDVIERQLAHKEGNAIKAAYNHARHLPERKKMMQNWADYLDELRAC